MSISPVDYDLIRENALYVRDCMENAIGIIMDLKAHRYEVADKTVQELSTGIDTIIASMDDMNHIVVGIQDDLADNAD